MKLLALDTATDACSAALWYEGRLTSRFAHAPREHSQRILPMLEDLLREAGLSFTELDALAFGRGPGSFTGVRIAAGVVQGLALAGDLPVVAVSSLQALALGCMDEGDCSHVLTAFDARMGEVYWAAWERDHRGLPQVLGDERVTPPAMVTVPAVTGRWCGAGSGWSSYEAELVRALGGSPSRVDFKRLPHAREVARLAVPVARDGRTVEGSQALPRYLRDSVAAKP